MILSLIHYCCPGVSLCVINYSTGLTLAENGTYRCELRSRSKVLSSIIHQIDVIGMQARHIAVNLS